MKNILHIGAYDLNFGDNIALLNIRKQLYKLNPDIEFKYFSIIEFFNKRNDINYCKSHFEKWNKEYDMVIVGGGGLIEGGNTDKYGTGYKLPFNKKLMDIFDIPVIFFSVGINYFRGVKGLSEKGKKSLLETINSAEAFSVRNDGSMGILKKLYGNEIVNKVYEVPDPGLMMDEPGFSMKSVNAKKVMFQPAMNNNKVQNEYRFNNSLNDLRSLIKKYKFDVYPHTLKDYKFPGESTDLKSKIIFSEKEFRNLVKFNNTDKSFSKYNDYRWGVVMRGHGQLVSFGLRLPCIYLVSQDKLKGFCEKYDLTEYMVDTREDNYLNQLEEKIKSMDEFDYIRNWYNIRDKHIKKIRLDFNQFCRKVLNILRDE